MTLHASVICISPLRRLFGFEVPDLAAVASALGIGAAVLVLLLVQKGLSPMIERAFRFTPH